MPHLVSGHMRFTEKDFLLTEYTEKIKEEVTGNKSKEELCIHSTRQFKNFFHNIKNDTISYEEQKAFLSEGLFKLTSLAHMLGFTLEDLIKEKI